MKNKIDIKNITEYGIKIVMNEDKIIKEGKYTLEEIYANIDDLADFSGMKKIDKNYYVSKNDTPSDLGCFAYTNLKRKSWFMENVKEWLWLDKKEGIDEIFYRRTFTWNISPRQKNSWESHYFNRK